MGALLCHFPEKCISGAIASLSPIYLQVVAHVSILVTKQQIEHVNFVQIESFHFLGDDISTFCHQYRYLNVVDT